MIPLTFTHQNIPFAGDLHLPAGPGPWPVLVVLHGASYGKRDDACYRHLAQVLPRHGIAVFLYDRRGSGGSGGDFATASFADLAGDAVAAVHALAGQPQIDPHQIGLYGISQGGWIAPLAAAQSDLVNLLVVVSGSGVPPSAQMSYAANWTLQDEGFGPEDIELALHLRSMVDQYYRGQITQAEVSAHLDWYKEEAWYKRAYLPEGGLVPQDVRTDKWFYEFDYDPLAVWAQVRQPALFLYAETDRWVPVEESIRLYTEHTRHLPEASFVRIPGADHLMVNLASGEESWDISSEYQQVLVEWLKKMASGKLSH